MKTVFFGPFVGELGWELVSWQGWVRHLCKTVFNDYRKIASGYPGRYPLYPYVDEFWPLPDNITSQIVSQRGYITDWWKNGLPRGSDNLRKFKWGVFPRFVKKYLTADGNLEDASLVIISLLETYRNRLPADTRYFVPFLLNRCPKYGITFGTQVDVDPKNDMDFKAFPIDLKYQSLERLNPTHSAVKFISEIMSGEKKFIAIFPRGRMHRRPALNWSKQNYEDLIQRLQGYFKDYTVAIFGDPKGAHFSDGVPQGCIDLINIDPVSRMDVQIAALRQSVLAIGGISGAMLLALACGCPALTFGVRDMAGKYSSDNYLKTRFIYYPFMHPEPDEVFILAKGMVDLKIPPFEQKSWQPLDYFNFAFRIRKRIGNFWEERIRNFIF